MTQRTRSNVSWVALAFTPEEAARRARPFPSDDDMALDDVTDEEWDAFQQALAERCTSKTSLSLTPWSCPQMVNAHRDPATAVGYRRLIDGRSAVVSFATVTEMRYGASKADWGSCVGGDSSGPSPGWSSCSPTAWR